MTKKFTRDDRSTTGTKSIFNLPSSDFIFQFFIYIFTPFSTGMSNITFPILLTTLLYIRTFSVAGERSENP